jgi:hypothetical protein
MLAMLLRGEQKVKVDYSRNGGECKKCVIGIVAVLKCDESTDMSLNTIQEIEHAIDALTEQQIDELYSWLDRHHPQPIDAQLKADLEAGRIDDRINRALADHRAGNIKPL